MSVIPPAARPTMRVIGRLESCACADVAMSESPTAARAERRVKVRDMSKSPGSGSLLRAIMPRWPVCSKRNTTRRPRRAEVGRVGAAGSGPPGHARESPPCGGLSIQREVAARLRDKMPRSEAIAALAELAAAPAALHLLALRARLGGRHAVGVAVLGPRHVAAGIVHVAMSGVAAD